MVDEKDLIKKGKSKWMRSGSSDIDTVTKKTTLDDDKSAISESLTTSEVKSEEVEQDFRDIGPMMETTAPKRTWSDEWPKYMDNYKDVYEQVSIVRKCINLIADFSISIGFDVSAENPEVEEEIEKMRRRTNFSEILKKSIKKREIWGNCAFHIIWNGDGQIKDFIPLDSERLEVIIDPDTMDISHFEYNTLKQGKIELEPEEVFYVAKDALDTRKTGVSALESIKTTINRKWNLEKDLEQASKRLWAPYTLFQYDTTYTKNKEQQKKEIRRFINKIEPGKTIVHNQQVEPEIIDMTPDISSLNEAIKSADEEIVGNWGIPKALLSREQTEDMSTLEFSIQTLYEGPIKSVQQYFKREIEKQIYDRIAERMGVENEEPEHIFKNNKFQDSPTIRALTYAVKEGVISPKSMIEMLGWSSKSLKSDIDDNAKPRERKPPEERPVTMDKLRQELSVVLDEEDLEELEDKGFFEKLVRKINKINKDELDC